MVKIYKSDAAKQKVIHSYNQLLAQWEVQYEEHHVRTAYGLTHCIVCGHSQNPPLVLFHGVGDNSAVMWMLNIKELSKHFFCIAVDTIGGPGKTAPNENYTKHSFDQVEWINQVVDHFKLHTIYLAGVSNGAYMAYNYTVQNPDRVHKAVCMEGGMVTSPVKAMISTLLIMFPEILIPTEKNLSKVLKKLSSPQTDLFIKHPDIEQHLILLMKSHQQQAMFAHKIEKYNRTEGAAVKDKLYFLIADHQLNRKKALIHTLDEGSYRYKVIANAGHGINHEQPAAINQEIIHFLKEQHK